MNTVSLTNELSDQQQQYVISRLYHLLSRETTKYLAGDSSSVPVEIVEELLRSMAYTLRFALRESKKPQRELLSCDLEALLQQGRELLQDKLAATRQLWEQACLTAPQIPNAYLQDTLKGIKAFFKQYDIRYFAHQIPCAVDYPLCIPVSEELQGVIYFEQWLRRLLIENWCLSRFPRQAICDLLSAVVADYWDYPLNLCQQPLINGIGLAILERPILALKLSDGDVRELASLLFSCPDIRAELRRGVERAAGQLQAPPEAASYMQAVADDTLPRIEAVRTTGDIGNIFVEG